MEIKTIKKENYRLHLVKNTLYKTVAIRINFLAPLKKETITKRALISSLLKSGTKSCPTKRDLSQKLEYLYGASIGITLSQIGASSVMSFNAYYPNPIFLDDHHLEEEIISLYKEVIFEPFLVNGLFSEKALEMEKRLLKEQIILETENKNRYAIKRLIESMYDNDETYSLKNFGVYEEIDPLTNKELVNYYYRMLNEDVVDIFVTGDIDFSKYEKLITDNFIFDKRDENNYELLFRENLKIKDQEITEEKDINQARLFLGYKTNIRIFSDEYHALALGNELLGGFVHSKLFQNVREKNSLCYYVSSIYDEFKGALIIFAGIDENDTKKALALIKEQVEDMKNGNITDEELQLTKDMVISNLYQVMDSLTAPLKRIYTSLLLKKNPDIDLAIEKINKITAQDIVNAFKTINLDTTYLLRGEKNGK